MMLLVVPPCWLPHLSPTLTLQRQFWWCCQLSFHAGYHCILHLYSYHLEVALGVLLAVPPCWLPLDPPQYPLQPCKDQLDILLYIQFNKIKRQNNNKRSKGNDYVAHQLNSPSNGYSWKHVSLNNRSQNESSSNDHSSKGPSLNAIVL